MGKIKKSAFKRMGSSFEIKNNCKQEIPSVPRGVNVICLIIKNGRIGNFVIANIQDTGRFGEKWFNSALDKEGRAELTKFIIFSNKDHKGIDFYEVLLDEVIKDGKKKFIIFKKRNGYCTPWAKRKLKYKRTCDGGCSKRLSDGVY